MGKARDGGSRGGASPLASTASSGGGVLTSTSSTPATRASRQPAAASSAATTTTTRPGGTSTPTTPPPQVSSTATQLSSSTLCNKGGECEVQRMEDTSTIGPQPWDVMGVSSDMGPLPDLMRVYESLSQSRTPHPSVASSKPHRHEVMSHQFSGGHHHHQKQHLQHAPPPPPQAEGASSGHCVSHGGPPQETAPQVDHQYHHTNQQHRPQHAQLPSTAPHDEASYAQPQVPTAKTSVPPPQQDPQVSGKGDKNFSGLDPSSASSVTAAGASRGPGRKRSSTSDECNTEGATTGAPPKKKKGQTDGRWSKRFAWPDELHRDFVSAVFDVGLKHSSPSAILEYMTKNEEITSERIKSHLQKYRLHREKSKKEFMTSYDGAVAKFKAGTMGDNKNLAAGEVAAHLSHASLTEGSSPTITERPGMLPNESQHEANAHGSQLTFPALTEDEKNTPIGMSLAYTMGLLYSLRQQLMTQRSSSSDTALPSPQDASPVPMAVQPDHNTEASESPVDAVYTAFLNSVPPGTVPAAEQGQPQPPHPAMTQPHQHGVVPLQTPVSQPPPVQNATAAAPPAPHIHHQHHQMQQVYWNPPPPAMSYSPPAPAQQQPQQQHQSMTTAGVPQTQSQGVHPGMPAAASAIASRSSATLEENQLMKRAMRNQMAFQNKMRALKQQEQEKSATSGHLGAFRSHRGADDALFSRTEKDPGAERTATRNDGVDNRSNEAANHNAPGSIGASTDPLMSKGDRAQSEFGLRADDLLDSTDETQLLFEFLMEP